QEAGFPASVRLADESELWGLRRDLMNEAVDAMYAENAEFSVISDILCDLRSEEGLTDTLLDIYDKLLRYPQALEMLSHSAAQMEAGSENPLDTPWGKVWADEVRAHAQMGQRLFARALDLTEAEPNAEKLIRRYSAYFSERLERYRTLLSPLEEKHYEQAREALCADFVIRKPGGKCPDRTPKLTTAMDLCDIFLKNQKEKYVPALSVFHTQEIAQSAAESARVLRLLHAALTRFDTAYRTAKLQREIAEFSDVSRAAYRLLVGKDGEPTALAAEVRSKYDAIFIDEYQDVDSMQDATFRAVADAHNRFMVGDIKQSIYRFRGAQPNVFADYRRRFPALERAKAGEPATVFMSNCFRCDKNVIDFSNTVSGDLFGSAAQSIGYSKEDDLVFSKDLPTPEYTGEKCRVVLIDRAKPVKGESDEEEKADASKAEARWIAREIARLLGGEKKADGTRILPADIAVLMRNASLAPHIAKHLAALGIPCNDTSRKSFFETPDVLCVYSLLAALDNPYRDVYLAAALRSPFFGFTLDDLVALHATNAGELSLYEAVKTAAQKAVGEDARSLRLRDFTERFSLWREKARTL
ncbi:MAG: UvrD-helicase domain-containing protein, partial [Clostridia bacterium]|nr:UvrD-helicase domain-containing protein [Clostridia bacterium]